MTSGPGMIASPEQRRYAHVLGIGASTGFALLVLSFLVYVLGLRKPLLEPAHAPQLGDPFDLSNRQFG